MDHLLWKREFQGQVHMGEFYARRLKKKSKSEFQSRFARYDLFEIMHECLKKSFLVITWLYVYIKDIKASSGCKNKTR
jgi:hypothetical protein